MLGSASPRDFIRGGDLTYEGSVREPWSLDVPLIVARAPPAPIEMGRCREGRWRHGFHDFVSNFLTHRVLTYSFDTQSFRLVSFSSHPKENAWGPRSLSHPRLAKTRRRQRPKRRRSGASGVRTFEDWHSDLPPSPHPCVCFLWGS